jgi:hypothetical protein
MQVEDLHISLQRELLLRSIRGYLSAICLHRDASACMPVPAPSHIHGQASACIHACLAFARACMHASACLCLHHMSLPVSPSMLARVPPHACRCSRCTLPRTSHTQRDKDSKSARAYERMSACRSEDAALVGGTASAPPGAADAAGDAAADNQGASRADRGAHALVLQLARA